MAIYHLSVQIISRSSGRSATAAAAYRAAEKIKDNRLGETHDYRKKKGVDFKLILAPNYAPAWVFNREKLWNEVERVERRKDSQLAREINVALPVELNNTQQLELVKKFVTEQFVNQGMVADVALHNLSSHNPHAHIMLTMRNIHEYGFDLKKNLTWNKKQLLEKQREAWAVQTNQALELAGVRQIIDHRSLEAQGINRIPQIHIGVAANAMMKRGIATERGELYEEIEAANRNIERHEFYLGLLSQLKATYQNSPELSEEPERQSEFKPTPPVEVNEELELTIAPSGSTAESDLLPSTDTEPEPEPIEEFVTRQQQEEMIRIASKFLHLAGVNVWSREGGNYHLMSNQKNLLVITATDNRGEILRYEHEKIMTQGLTLQDVENFAQVDAWLDQKVEEIQARELNKRRQQGPELEL
ncbi:MAG: MobQ family relaxase [Prochloraceae cyanobacterium]|nr:MobQ family relaxase [Prochloraceae cyanobacterium]